MNLTEWSDAFPKCQNQSAKPNETNPYLTYGLQILGKLHDLDMSVDVA
jgi:hypothetical protein